MSQTPSHEKYFRKAQEKEASFEWAEAEKEYQLAFSARIEKGEILEAGETQERAAYCMYRAAYQSETKEEFKDLLESASRSYGVAAEIYQELEGPKREARTITNRAMEHFYKSWLIEDPSERKTQVSLCVEEFKDALQSCENVENGIWHGKVSNDFLAILYSLSELSFTYTESLEIIDYALNYGSKALSASKKGNDRYELARCYYLLSLFFSDRHMDVIESVVKQQELLQLGMGYAETALELSQEVGDPYIFGLSCGILSYYTFEVKDESEAALSLVRRQLEIGERIRDKFILGRANENLSYYLGWLTALEEDREKIRAKADEAISYAEEAISHYMTVLNPILTAFLPHNEGSRYKAQFETDFEIKRKLVVDSLEASNSDLKYAVQSGSQLGEMTLHGLLAATHLYLAILNRDEKEKIKSLMEAMRLNKVFIDKAMESKPFRYQNLMLSYYDQAVLRGQLAKLEDTRERQKEILLEAIEDIEKSLELYNLHIQVSNVSTDHHSLGTLQITFGETLLQLHLVSEDEKYLRQAIKLFEDAIKTYSKSNVPSTIANILWKKASAFYQIREYQKSAAEFDGASRYYIQTGEKYPNNKEFYHDYGNYMEAWGNIARAMDYHSRDEYFLEKEYFEKAVHLQMSSERWRYLSPNYLAWARLAEAENQSRNEQCEKAIELFQESSDLFSSAKKSLETKLSSIGMVDEASMANELILASDLRRDYCHGRAALEEAKLLDRRGEHTASSRRYGDAAQTFLKIVEALESESERREIKPLHTLCLAWQKMTQAEAESSPDRYNEASVLFDNAREYSPNEKTKLLTRGHASFCKALGAGIRYEVSREVHLHQELVQHIGSATDFYVRAGFDSAVEYSRATQRLFEAYQYMDRARGEVDPGDKTKYFTIAERLLGASAEAFQRARHPEKRDEVARLLQSLKHDRGIAVSLSEILDTPGISHSTESFRAPTPSHEYPVGLESLERADIQARIFLPDDTVNTGEEFDIELELYNPGKNSASLVRVENLIPGDFEVGRVSGIYRYDEDALDLRGKRIGPLGTLEVSLKASPLSKGQYSLEPRVVFIDDTGECRTSEPEPATVTVSEMGILSWLRGTRRPD